MKLPAHALALLAGSAVTAFGCGGTQSLPPATSSARTANVTVANANTTNSTASTPPQDEPGLTSISSPPPPEDIPVDCGRG